MGRISKRRLIAGLTLTTAALPAQAITVQSAPTPSAGNSALADPDARLDEMVDRRRAQEARDVYDPSRAASVLRFGERPAGAGAGTIRWAPFGR